LFLNKKIVGSVVILVTILLIISVVNSPFSVDCNDKNYLLNSEIVFAYFKPYETSRNSTVFSSNTLISYVFVLNVTNPNNETVLLDNLLVAFHDFAVKDRNSVSGTTEIIRYCDTFGSNDLDYLLPSKSSRLMAFTGTSEISSLELTGIKNGTIFSSMTMNGNVKENAHVGTGLLFKEMSFDMIHESEWIYNTVFPADQQFSFRNDSPTVAYE